MVDGRRTIGVAGSGEIADAFEESLGLYFPSYLVARRTRIAGLELDNVDAVVITSDNPDPRGLQAINRRLYRESTPYLFLWAEFSRLRLGPLVRPSLPGCLYCAEYRRLHCHRHKRYFVEALNRAAEQARGCHGMTAAIALAVTAACEVISASLDGGGEIGRFWLIETENSTMTRHRFLPVALCETCGLQREDARTFGEFELRSDVAAKVSGGWRVRNYVPQLQQLRERFVDHCSGLLTNLGIDIENPLCATGSGRFPMGDCHNEQWSAGTSFEFGRSKTVAILETLERYAGLEPRGRKSVVRGSLTQLGADAIDPRSLTLYSPWQYALPDFLCVPFHDKLQTTWVWGRSLREQRPILVPEQHVYYDALRYPRGERFVVDTSSG